MSLSRERTAKVAMYKCLECGIWFEESGPHFRELVLPENLPEDGVLVDDIGSYTEMKILCHDHPPCWITESDYVAIAEGASYWECTTCESMHVGEDEAEDCCA